MVVYRVRGRARDRQPSVETNALEVCSARRTARSRPARAITKQYRRPRRTLTVSDILAAMSNDPQNQPHGVTTASAKGLGQLQNARARITEALIARLNDPDSSVQCEVALALGRTGGDRAIEALIARLDDPDPFVRTSNAMLPRPRRS
jgi:HEAT repeat protein